jgi:hypothetical protein
MANRGSYPHPVIDSADDVASDFEVINILVDPSQQDIEISYDIRTNDPDLLGLLDSGKASHSLRWRCSSTISTGEMKPVEYQRSSNGFRMKAWLDQQLVKGSVAAEVRIIVKEDMCGHQWSNQHAQYGDASFDLQPGDVLADAGYFEFDAEKKYDPLDPPLGSCFSFVRSASLHKGIKVAFDGDETVAVQIPAKTFDAFKLFAHRPDLQIALVVLPALMETLSFINSSDDEPLDDKAWYVAINSLVDESGGWDQKLIELAQKILEKPIDNVLQAGFMSEEED